MHWRPVLRGRIVATESGCRLEGRVWISSYVALFMAMWGGIVLVAVLWVVSNLLYPAAGTNVNWASLFVPIVIAAPACAVFLFAWSLVPQDGWYLQQFLDAVFQGHMGS